MKKIMAFFILASCASLLHADPYYGGSQGGCGSQGSYQDGNYQGQYQQGSQGQYPQGVTPGQNPQGMMQGQNMPGQNPQGGQAPGQNPQGSMMRGQPSQGWSGSTSGPSSGYGSNYGASGSYGQNPQGGQAPGQNPPGLPRGQPSPGWSGSSSGPSSSGFGYGDTSDNSAINSGNPSDDQRITARIRDALKSAFSNKFNNVTVTFSNGTVTLQGTVPTQDDKNTLDKIVHAVSGVRNVVNQVTVQNPSS